MKHVNNVKGALEELYSSKKYLIITFSAAILLFLFNILINNYQILLSDFSFSLFSLLIKGTISMMTTSSLFFLIITSVFAGVVLAMILFLIKRQIKGSIGASSSGIFVSLIAPACPSCSIGLLSVFGFGGFLAFLPFKGLELRFLSVGLLGVSTVHLSNKITTKTCDLTEINNKKQNKDNIKIEN